MGKAFALWSVGFTLTALLFGCGQTPVPVAADPYAGPDHPWVSAALPEGQLSALSLTPGENNLYFEPILSASNGWGPIEIDRSNGEWKAGDGNPLTLDGQQYPRGFGVHAPSELRYGLGGANLGGNNTAKCSTFTADIGIDAEVGSKGSVVFQIFLDGQKAYDSGPMTGASATKKVNLALVGKRDLRLVVTDAGDGKSYDHADWANPKIICAAATPKSGSVDPSFGVNGEASIAGLGQPIGVLADGGIVLQQDTATQTIIRRLKPDGSVDNSYTTGGKLTLALQAKVLTYPDGRLLALENLFAYDNPEQTAYTASATIRRYLPNGQLDKTFGNNGSISNSLKQRGGIPDNTYGNVFRLESNGKFILVQGSFFTRFKSNGQIDTAFGVNGQAGVKPYIYNDSERIFYINTVLFRSNGGYIVYGSNYNGDSYDDEVHLIYYSANGALETDKIILTGRFASTIFADIWPDDSVFLINEQFSSFALRYQTDGQVIQYADVGDNATYYQKAKTVGRDRLIAFDVFLGIPNDLGNPIIQFDGQGRLDATFANNGILNFPTTSLILQNDARFLAANKNVIRRYWQ